MSPSTNLTTRRSARSAVRRLGVVVALSSTGILMTGSVTQAATARPVEGFQRSYSPDSIACSMKGPGLGDCFIDTNDHEDATEAVAVVIFDPSDPL